MPGIQDLNEALTLLEHYTKISSGSLNHEGVRRAQDFLAQQFLKLNFSLKWHSNAFGESVSAPLLEAYLPGYQRKFITFISHADTLDHGIGEDAEIPVFRSDEQMTAPGVLDDKASQVVGLWALGLFLAKNLERAYGLRFVSSPNEELGSRGFHQLFDRFAEDSAVVLGLEPAYDGSHIITERRGNRWYKVEVRGLSAHSGRDPEKGLSALHDFGLKIPKLLRLNKLSKGLSLNIGEISSPQPTYNLVAGTATAKIDLRFLDAKSRERAHRRIHRILSRPTLKALSNGRQTETLYEIVDDCPPLKSTRASRKLADHYLEILSRIEKRKDLKSVRSGGAADVCYMAREGILVIDGLGACGGHMHREDEFVVTASIESRARALAELLVSLNDD